jgi:hypothetical protein
MSRVCREYVKCMSRVCHRLFFIRPWRANVSAIFQSWMKLCQSGNPIWVFAVSRSRIEEEFFSSTCFWFLVYLKTYLHVVWCQICFMDRVWWGRDAVQKISFLRVQLFSKWRCSDTDQWKQPWYLKAVRNITLKKIFFEEGANMNLYNDVWKELKKIKKMSLISAF